MLSGSLNTSTGLQQADAYLKTALHYFDLPGSHKTDMDSGIVYASAAKALSMQLKYKRVYNHSIYLLGRLHLEKMEVARATIFLKESKDTLRADLLMAFSHYYNYHHKNKTYFDTAVYFAAQCKELALSLHDDDRTVGASEQIGNTYYASHQFGLAEKEFLELIEFSKRRRLPFVEKYYNMLSSIHIIDGDLSKALMYSLEAEKHLEKAADKSYAGTVYFNLGTVYRNTGKYEKSISSFRSGLDAIGKKKIPWFTGLFFRYQMPCRN